MTSKANVKPFAIKLSSNLPQLRKQIWIEDALLHCCRFKRRKINKNKKEPQQCRRSVSVVSNLFERVYDTGDADMKYLKLNSGGHMPIVGYGTWKALDNDLEDALNEALKCGYRHVDTASRYGNERVIGKVLNEWMASGRVTRDELFVVTKLPPTANRPEDVEECLKKSLQDLQLDYVDLYLIHTPFGLKIAKDHETDPGSVTADNSTDNLKTWKEMEKQVDCGKTKAIGLSNFNSKQIQRVLDSCRIKPDNLQIEYHLYLQQPELIKFCNKNGIVVTSYSTLGTKDGRRLLGATWRRELPEMLENEVVLKIAEKHCKTPAQVLLRFVVQQDVAVIPKSTNLKRVAENIQVVDFELDMGDVEKLKAQDAGEGGRILSFEYFPGVLDHPEYPFPKESLTV